MDLALYIPAEGGFISAAEFDLLSLEPAKTYLIDESHPHYRVTLWALFSDKERVWIGPEMVRLVDIESAIPETFDFQLMDAGTLLSLVGVIPAPWDESLPPLPAVEKMVDDIRARVSSILAASI